MNRLLNLDHGRLTAALMLIACLAWQAPVSAQAIKCRDLATGAVLYTDQPCKGGQLVVPARTPQQIEQDEQAAARARELNLQRQEWARERERQQLQVDQAQVAMAAASTSPVASQACRDAMAEAKFRAASFSATKEQIRTARYNAALACGQQPPADIVVVRSPPVICWPDLRPLSTTPADSPLAIINRRSRGVGCARGSLASDRNFRSARCVANGAEYPNRSPMALGVLKWARLRCATLARSLDDLWR